MAQVKTQCIAIELEGGRVAIMHYVLEDIRTGVVRDASDEAIEAEITKAKLQKISWRRINLEDLPKDRTFRNAWRADLSVDIKKAKKIYKDKIREMRKPFLESLDIEYQRADEIGDVAAKASIAKRKQALRDATSDPAIDAAKTPEELMAVVPSAIRTEREKTK